MDIFDRIKGNRGPLGQYAEAAEGYYIFPKLTGELGNRMFFKGKEVIMWSINDYLGLANHPEVRKVDGEAFAEYGLAYPMGARMMSGNTDQHDALEVELADFVKKEKAVLVNFGYQGIVSAIDCLLTRRDVVVYDADAHACIIDGLRLHMGKRFSYMHNDVESCEKHLKTAISLAEEQGGGVMVITEGVFGMQGEQGKLKEIVALKKKYNFRLLVDDAHGFGTQGATGAGTGEEQGVQDEIDVYFSTFAKSMGSIGAFFAGDADIMQFLKYNMRSQIFAKSMPIGQVIGNRKRLQLLRDNVSLKNKLWENVNLLQSGLRSAGFDIGKTNSCVTPVFMHGSVEEATALVEDLRENFHIFCSIVVYPVIPKGRILLRLIPTATHTVEDINFTIDAFVSIKDKLAMGVYQRDAIIIPN
ncbi:MAG: pyridoxal phosphate-dependent aminotransferase family protein [Saprospiraceae bacterium]|nr:pyridoxal phosphate-dependent aminotransferase family protein [Saprospiraceae bacterium]MBK8634394.1 pyridoxal phosphate-dependent aminotransferase family protein [Saprospiraceae bacterium]MBP7642213.1 pyridoxal phosphate-dependent aminotransferase family protein [Saprospiraceae bacterium]HMS69042.1 pyridoxal phosphate-dependent aminotransferase family protein [Saprospiraceae bacterium]